MEDLRARLKRIPLVERVHSAVKGRWQERAAASSLRRDRAEAERRGIVPLADGALADALRRRLAGRTRAARRRGDLNVFLAYGLTNWEAILPRATAPFGRVTAFEWRSRGFDDTAPDWLARRDAMNTAMLDAFAEAARPAPVDAVVGYLSGHNTSPATLERMAAAGAVVFNFCWDDQLGFPGPVVGGRHVSPAALAAAVDLNLTNVPESIVRYALRGGLALFWPEAAQPDVHRPYDLPFEHDVGFVGGRYGFRPFFIDALRRRGISVACFGRGWPGGVLSDDELPRAYARSRINLGFGGVGHSRRLTCLKGRDFEIPMSGGLYLSQASAALGLVFRPGEEIATYRDADDCARVIRDLLADPGRAAAIRARGRQRCLRDHTWDARFSTIFRLAGLME